MMKYHNLLFVLVFICCNAAAGSASALDLDLNRLFSAGKDLATAATGVDEKDEIAMGREIAGRMLGAAPLVADPELQAYVNRVGRWVASQTERADLPWHFGVLDTSDDQCVRRARRLRADHARALRHSRQRGAARRRARTRDRPHRPAPPRRP